MYDFSWTEGSALVNAILSYKPPPIHLQYMYICTFKYKVWFKNPLFYAWDVEINNT